ncbi:hypothetical protein F9K77_07080 [Ochrobactrum sp. LMG 5442]|nr:hypothetical protein F9K77_07080 [Ochrobactrum sp. LMG 5442]
MTIATDLIYAENGTEMAQAHSLRRYLVRRAAGKKTSEYTAHGMEIEKDRALATGVQFRRVRQDGQGWCEWLGLDTSIQYDALLQAYFSLCMPNGKDGDPDIVHFLNQRLKECQSNRLKALRRWRTLGAEAMARAAAQRVSPMSNTELAKAKLKPIYLRKPSGKKPLKAPAKPTPPRGRTRNG